MALHSPSLFIFISSHNVQLCKVCILYNTLVTNAQYIFPVTMLDMAANNTEKAETVQGEVIPTVDPV